MNKLRRRRGGEGCESEKGKGAFLQTRQQPAGDELSCEQKANEENSHQRATEKKARLEEETCDERY